MIFYKKNRSLLMSGHCFLLLSAGLALSTAGHSQNVSLTDLSFFDKPGPSWRIVGDVNASLQQHNTLTVKPGSGILVNISDEKNHGADLLTQLQHADADIEFDYLMSLQSNSGVYLQGRYEVQLFDSWDAVNPTYSDNGGIYQRYDDMHPKGIDGFAPRVNSSFAPGTWQHMKISFQAPRFDASGNKIANARILKAELNGVTIHENLELRAPTAGSMGAEVAEGPLRIQGDHGSIAIRNLSILNYNKPQPVISNVKYSLYKGRYEAAPDFRKLVADSKGDLQKISAAIDTKKQTLFLARYTADLKITEPGDYQFDLDVLAGGGVVKIDGQPIGAVSDRSYGKTHLDAGNYTLEVLYGKSEDWGRPSLSLHIAGPGIRQYLASDASSVLSEETDPILVDAAATPVLRSFMDIAGSGRVTHAISVAFPQNVHYTYDLDKGNLVQVWRGGFLDATPMWHDRGDGSSRPSGAVRALGAPAFALDLLTDAGKAWRTDSAGTSYRPLGYMLDENERPSFMYQAFGAKVKDAIKVMDKGTGFSREITIEHAPANLYYRLATASKIESLENGLYLVGDKQYYIRTNANASIRDAGGSKELIVPVQDKLVYSILF